jgi:methyl coenzyme M reductase beta subunit
MGVDNERNVATNAEVIEKFLSVIIEINEYDDRVVFLIRPGQECHKNECLKLRMDKGVSGIS